MSLLSPYNKKRFYTILGLALLLAPGGAWAITLAGRVALAPAETTETAQDAAAESVAAAKHQRAGLEWLDADDATERGSHRDLAWLGLATEEASEALAAQLDLPPGVGLVVTYVATNSPAANAGLKKNDLLVQFEDQSLVHPAQLRKLVHSRKEGEAVKLTFYRAGKKETVSATLGKRAVRFGILEDDGSWGNEFRQLRSELKELPIKEAIEGQLKAVRDSLGNIKIDQRKVQGDVRRSMEETRHALHDALRGLSNVDLGPIRKTLEELAHSGVEVDPDATVTVRSTGKSNRSLVKSDDTGTVVIVANPKLRLTAHDKDGHLLFDGEIQTADDRAKVPQELWERVEPLLKKMEE